MTTTYNSIAFWAVFGQLWKVIVSVLLRFTFAVELNQPLERAYHRVFVFLQVLISSMYLLTAWEGLKGKYLARKQSFV